MNDVNEWDDAVIVALGSNRSLGDAAPIEILEAALERFAAFGLEVVKQSRWWRSAAWPDPSGPEFANGVVLVRTALGPEEVLAALHKLEAEFGRERSEPNAPRTLDLDLIAYGRTVRHNEPIEAADRETLLLPHPRAHERLFVMGPLVELTPTWRHPLSGKTSSILATEADVGRDAAPIGGSA